MKINYMSEAKAEEVNGKSEEVAEQIAQALARLLGTSKCKETCENKQSIIYDFEAERKKRNN